VKMKTRQIYYSTYF